MQPLFLGGEFEYFCEKRNERKSSGFTLCTHLSGNLLSSDGWRANVKAGTSSLRALRDGLGEHFALFN